METIQVVTNKKMEIKEAEGKRIKDLSWVQERGYMRFLLGGRCARCGKRDFRCLQIDHVLDNGAEIRRFGKDHKGFSDFSYDLRRFFIKPEEYQVLCANHNQIKKYVKQHPE